MWVHFPEMITRKVKSDESRNNLIHNVKTTLLNNNRDQFYKLWESMVGYTMDSPDNVNDIWNSMLVYGLKGLKTVEYSEREYYLKIYNGNIVYLLFAVTDSVNHPSMYTIQSIFTPK